MTHPFFAKHESTLTQALQAQETRGYWSPFPEMPSPKVYGETANAHGEQSFKALLNQTFDLDQPSNGLVGQEHSPFGFALGVRYPKADPDRLFAAVARAQQPWQRAGRDAWVGVSLEILQRLNRASFEIAYSVMHTTGQAFMMAFQAGGPHAQDRALEAITCAWDQLRRIPAQAYWEKPQGKNPPLAMEKHFTIVPRGIGLVLGCCTFPTWNSYPGLFADLATGNAVVVKPHPGAILPLAITVRIARDVLREAGFDPNVVTLLATDPDDDGTLVPQLATRPDVRLIDFTGSTHNGNWLERNATQAQVYTEKAGVNQIVIDSVDDIKAAARNIAFSLALYSGQMCTAPQNIYVPRDGIRTADGTLSFDEVGQAIAEAVQKLTSDPAKAVELIGALQNDAVVQRIERARALGTVLLESQPLGHPTFEHARVHTPLLVKLDAATDQNRFTQEWFGPIAFVIATDSTAQSLALAGSIAAQHGALTLSVYSGDEAVQQAAHEAAIKGGVALSLNLTGGVFVNQSAAFSDFHGTGANPAANATLTDAAFVANRFRVVQSRAHVAPRG